MVVAGLTGNYGMGKSFVLSSFKSLGAATLDSDRIVDILLNDRDVKKRVRELFGDEVIDRKGKLKKRLIAEKIFSNSTLRGHLERILHPLVFDKINDFIAGIKNRAQVVIVEVPLLFEGAYFDRFQKVITVYTTQQKAIERLRSTGISRSEVLSRLRAQLPIRLKKKRSDYTIDNNGSRSQTREQVERIYRLLIKEAEKK